MRFWKCPKLLSSLLPVAALALGSPLPARADIGYHGHRCNPSCAVFASPFYGYYRTCWRPWPGGQPPCPVCPKPVSLESARPVPPAAEPATPPEKPGKPPETLPLPSAAEPAPQPAALKP